MQISFRSIQKASDGVELHGTVELPSIADENTQVQKVEPISVDLKAQAEASEHLCRVRGRLGTTVTYQCSRCLEDYESKLVVQLDECFTDVPSKSNEDIHLVSGDVIELTPYIDEAINLAIEYVPVCSEDCKGLCSVCGCNKNHTTCTCETKPIDPRLAALEDLLSSDDSQ